MIKEPTQAVASSSTGANPYTPWRFPWNTRCYHCWEPWVALTEGWLELHRERIQIDGVGGSQLTAVVTRKKGTVVPDPYSPYFAIEFTPSPNLSEKRIASQWLELSAILVQKLLTYPWHRPLRLPPTIQDVRSFAWARLSSETFYTFYLPREELGVAHLYSPDARRRAKRALEAGYTVQRNTDIATLWANILASESRSEFSYGLSASRLSTACETLGSEYFRIYNAYGKHQEPASSMVVLYRPGGVILEWLAGTDSKHLSSGVSQLVFHHVLEDIAHLESPGFDFCGANLPGVAAAKVQFGGHLIPCYQVQPVTARLLAKTLVRAGRRYRDVYWKHLMQVALS